jgi:uncharacterized membrane-anchored protein
MIHLIRVGIIASVMTGMLAYMISERMALLRKGTLIQLEVTPVDPRSLFRGDYVILDYAITNLDAKTLTGDDDFGSGDPVFVTLRKIEGNWEPIATHKTLVPNLDEDVVIAGTVRYARYQKCRKEVLKGGGSNRVCDEVAELTVIYGIESFFVPEGIGKSIEDQRNQGRISVEVAVDDAGNSGIKSLLLDGEVLYEETLF